MAQIDTGIYGLMGRGVKSVNDYDNEALDLRRNALAARGDELKFSEMQRGMAEQEQVRNALSRVGPNATQQDVWNTLRGTNTLYGHSQANAQEKAAVDMMKDRAAASSSMATAGKTSLETLKGRVGLRMDILQNATSPMQVIEYSKRAVEGGHMKPEEFAEGISDMPKTPTEWADWKNRQLAQGMEYAKRIELMGKQANDLMVPDPKNPGKFVTNEPLVQAKARVAQAGAPISYGSPITATLQDNTPVLVQPGNRPGAAPQIMTDPRSGTPLRPGPSKKAGELSATAQKELFEADDSIQSGRAVVGILTDALKLNDKAYSGYGAKGRAVVRSNLPGDSASADATISLDNMMTGQALESLKLTFGGMPTEGERKILLDIQASADKTPAQRKDIIERAIRAANVRIAFNQKKAAALRDGSYMTQGVDPQQAAPASPSAAPAAQPGGGFKYLGTE